jgi:hypothetical protein
MNKPLIALLLCCTAPLAHADPVFKSINDNGIFTPFNSATPANTRYGDGGWLTNFQPNGIALTEITLGLVTTGGTRNGTTDISFTFNDGDPSGLVFGTGSTRYSTVIRNVPLTTDEAGPSYFNLTIPLPSIETLGGFNNIGFSIGVSNFNFDGNFGFQCASAFGQPIGFYTNNASQFNGTNWSLFAFGAGNFGVANFVAEIVPAPSTGVLLAIGTMLVSRRRR